MQQTRPKSSPHIRISHSVFIAKLVTSASDAPKPSLGGQVTGPSMDSRWLMSGRDTLKQTGKAQRAKRCE